MTDISKEAVEHHISRCWMTDPEPDKTETLLRAQAARIAELEAALATARADAMREAADRLSIVGYMDSAEIVQDMIDKELTP